MMLALLFACSSEATDAPVAIEPQPNELSECGVCGMTVGEQPAPRAQLQDRDGHVHFCSIGDLRAFLSAPSPRGEALGIWVEALPQDYDAAGLDSSPQAWVPAEQATFVVGFQRGSVMGLPVLSYAEEGHADQAAKAVEGHTTDWGALKATSFDQVP